MGFLSRRAGMEQRPRCDFDRTSPRRGMEGRRKVRRDRGAPAASSLLASRRGLQFSSRRCAMNMLTGADRNIPTSLLIGAPLVLAGSAATFLFYRSGADSGRADARRRMRQVRDVMSENPACCRPETPLREVAEMMVANDCGEIPICDGARRPIGVVTDRDIVCRLLAKGHDPLHATAKDCMSRP